MTEEVTSPEPGQDVSTTEAPETSQPSWTDSLGEDQRAYAETKGFKDPASVLESYKNLEKLRGVPEDQLLKLPKEMTPDAMGEVYDRLGRPESAENYTRALGDDFNDDAYKAITAEAHKLGLTDAQFEGLQKITGETAASVERAQDEAAAAAFDKWKDSNAEGFQNAAALMSGIGMDEAGLEKVLMGDKAGVYDFLAKVAERSGEGRMIDGKSTPDSFNMSPAAATQKINELYNDKDFMAAYTSPNQKRRQPAIERMERLQQARSKGS